MSSHPPHSPQHFPDEPSQPELPSPSSSSSDPLADYLFTEFNQGWPSWYQQFDRIIPQNVLELSFHSGFKLGTQLAGTTVLICTKSLATALHDKPDVLRSIDEVVAALSAALIENSQSETSQGLANDHFLRCLTQIPDISETEEAILRQNCLKIFLLGGRFSMDIAAVWMKESFDLVRRQFPGAAQDLLAQLGDSLTRTLSDLASPTSTP